MFCCRVVPERSDACRSFNQVEPNFLASAEHQVLCAEAGAFGWALNGVNQSLCYSLYVILPVRPR